LWLNLERTLDKQRGKMGVLVRRQLKKVITLQRATTKNGRQGDTTQLLPRVTPTLVTPLASPSGVAFDERRRHLNRISQTNKT